MPVTLSTTSRSVRVAAARAARGAVGYLSRTRAAHQDKPYLSIHDRFREFTMIGVDGYIANLRLAETAATLDGDVVECGTWRGGMIAGVAAILGDANHEYHLFDSFEGLPPVKEIDGAAALAYQANEHDDPNFDNCRAEAHFAETAMQRAPVDRFEIHEGWFEDTVPAYAAAQPSIAVLRLDGDWYDSTIVCLRELHPLVVPGGLVIIDDYDPWDGCARAVHTYLAESSSTDRINRFRNVAYMRHRGTG